MTNAELQEMYEDMDNETLLSQAYLRLVNTAHLLKSRGFDNEATANTAIAKTLAKRFEF